MRGFRARQRHPVASVVAVAVAVAVVGVVVVVVVEGIHCSFGWDNHCSFAAAAVAAAEDTRCSSSAEVAAAVAAEGNRYSSSVEVAVGVDRIHRSAVWH